MTRPETSLAAYHTALPHAGTAQRKLYDLILARPSTDDELEQATGLSHQCVSARTNELRHLGMIYDSRARRRTRQGGIAAVWTALLRPAEGACVHCLGRGCLVCGGSA